MAELEKEKRPCSFCSKTFVRKWNKTQHIRIFHTIESDISYPCICCDALFQTRYEWEEHKRLEHGPNDQRRWLCGHCKATFAHKSNRNLHEREQHNPEMKIEWVCDDCDERFPTKRALRDHKRLKHSGSLQYICRFEGCSQNSLTPKRRSFHEKTVHMGWRPFPCSYGGCYARYVSRADLRRHISAFHKGLKPFPCPYEDCDTHFTKKSGLKCHILAVHKGLKPFPCRIPGCNENFSRRGNRNMHEKSHNGVLSSIWKKQGHKWEEIFKEIWKTLKPGSERAWHAYIKVIFEDIEKGIIPEARHFDDDINGYVIWDAKRWKGAIMWKDLNLYPLAASYMEFFVLYGKDEEGITPNGTPYSIVGVDTLMKRLREKETPENAQQIRNIYDKIQRYRNGFFDFEPESNQTSLFE